MTSALLRPLAVLVAAGAIALAGCGGDGDSGSDPAPSGTTGTASTDTAAARPTLAASQEIVDLVNRYTEELPAVDEIDQTSPAALEEAAGRYGGAADAIMALVEQVTAHECVERLAGDQAGVMRDIADFVEAATEGNADEAREIGERIGAFDEATHEREKAACKAEVGYRGQGDR
jgi:hypothetical protein